MANFFETDTQHCFPIILSIGINDA